MRISEVARKTGVSTRAIRYYEQKKLIHSTRLENGYRVYNQSSIEQVKTIQLYLKLGFTTDQISGFLNCVIKNTEAFCQEIMPIYETKIKELDEQIRLLSNIKSNLIERVSAIQQEKAILLKNQNGEG